MTMSDTAINAMTADTIPTTKPTLAAPVLAIVTSCVEVVSFLEGLVVEIWDVVVQSGTGMLASLRIQDNFSHKTAIGYNI